MPELIVSGSPIVYDEQGTGDPIVFLHAGIADRHMWDTQFAHFSPQHRVIRYDQRGYGQTPYPADAISYVDDLRDVMDALDVPKATLVGCSLGGMVSLEFTVLYPERVNKMVLVGSSIVGYKPTASMPPQWELAREAFQGGDYERVAEIAVQVFMDGEGRSGPPVPEALRTYVYKHYYASHSNLDQQPEIIWPEPPAVQYLADIYTPTLVVVGSLDTDQIKEMADLLSKGILNARKVVIDQTAHLPNMEQPDLFNSLLQDFIASNASGTT